MSSNEISRLQNLEISIYDAATFFSIKENCLKFPLLHGVFEYWNEKRGDKNAPHYEQINLIELPPEVISRSVVVDVLPEGPDFICRFWGTNVVNSTGQELTGKSIKDLSPKSLSEKSYESYSQVYKTRLPIVERTYGKAFSVESDELFLRLPMSSNGVDVDVILTAVEIQPKDSEAFKEHMAQSISESKS